jgi:hypothetical protein
MNTHKPAHKAKVGPPLWNLGILGILFWCQLVSFQAFFVEGKTYGLEIVSWMLDILLSTFVIDMNDICFKLRIHHGCGFCLEYKV